MLNKVLKELKPESKFIIKGDKIEWLSKDIPQPTQEEIDNKAKELESIEKVNTIYKDLQDLCDTKSKEAKKYIIGREVTDEQLARYEEKYQIAKEYKTSGRYKDRLSLEAKLQGLTVDDLADLIIKKGDEYKEALITFNARIEAFRVKVSNIIEQGDLDKANEIIKEAYNLGANSSDDDVAKLFES
jgi:molybdopterin converting factor small subunit